MLILLSRRFSANPKKAGHLLVKSPEEQTRTGGSTLLVYWIRLTGLQRLGFQL
jgi:hypothetical protein